MSSKGYKGQFGGYRATLYAQLVPGSRLADALKDKKLTSETSTLGLTRVINGNNVKTIRYYSQVDPPQKRKVPEVNPEDPEVKREGRKRAVPVEKGVVSCLYLSSVVKIVKIVKCPSLHQLVFLCSGVIPFLVNPNGQSAQLSISSGPRMGHPERELPLDLRSSPQETETWLPSTVWGPGTVSRMC